MATRTHTRETGSHRTCQKTYCLFCKESFIPKIEGQRFCSDNHRKAQWKRDHAKPKSGAVVKSSCRYCHRPFTKNKPNQEFCCGDHRAAFWKHGSLTYEQIWAQFERKIAAELAPLRARLDATEESLRQINLRDGLAVMVPDMYAKRGGGAAA